jgi:phosphatidate cytidylyltransferase
LRHRIGIQCRWSVGAGSGDWHEDRQMPFADLPILPSGLPAAAAIPGLGAPLATGLAAIAALLVTGSLAAAVLVARDPVKWADLGPRMRSWWIIVALVTGALLAGPAWLTALFALVSFVALREFVTLAPTRREDRPVVLLAFLAVPVAYSAVLIDNYAFFLTLIPVYLFLLMAFAMAWIGRTEKFLATAGILYWGVVVCVTNIAYVPFLMHVPSSEAGPAGAAGLVFFLLVATQLNDVAQYVWGRAFGQARITPLVSPNKTWAGAVGGFATTAALIWFAGPVFTPLPPHALAILAVILPVAGFAGDITMSAIKRDLGVKDTGDLLPGHGGALDRLDSLTFTAPLYFHILAFFALERF